MSTMKDAIGAAHARCETRPRIACLVPSITELLFDLGLGENVVARTGFCVHPAPQVLAVPKVGGTKDVNIKKLLSLQPTYIIVNIDENRKEVIDEIKKNAPRVEIVVSHPCAPEDNAALYALLGFIFQREEQANALITQLHAALAEAKAATLALPRESALYLIWKDPWMTVGTDTYIARTLALIGWDCAQPEDDFARYPTLIEHNALWRTVDRVLLSSEPYAFRETHLAEIALRAPQAAIQLIDGELTSWYGSRAIASMRALASLRLGAAARPVVTYRAAAAN
jgi:ABC-type hemin transport system substrate-binding protein